MVVKIINPKESLITKLKDKGYKWISNSAMIPKDTDNVLWVNNETKTIGYNLGAK